MERVVSYGALRSGSHRSGSWAIVRRCLHWPLPSSWWQWPPGQRRARAALPATPSPLSCSGSEPPPRWLRSARRRSRSRGHECKWPCADSTVWFLACARSPRLPPALSARRLPRFSFPLGLAPGARARFPSLRGHKPQQNRRPDRTALPGGRTPLRRQRDLKRRRQMLGRRLRVQRPCISPRRSLPI